MKKKNIPHCHQFIYRQKITIAGFMSD